MAPTWRRRDSGRAWHPRRCCYPEPATRSPNLTLAESRHDVFRLASSFMSPTLDPNEVLPQGRSRETDIRRDAKRQWWKADEKIDHPNLTRSFDGWIDRVSDGRYCLSNDINWGYIGLEGPAYFVLSARVDDDGGMVTLSLSGDREEVLDPSTLREDEHGALWCDVREGRCPARFENAASTALADLLEEDEEGVFFTIGGSRYRPSTGGSE